LPTSVEPVKATLSTSGWAASAAPAVSPNPVRILDDAVREAGLLDQLTEPQCAERRLLGRLENDRATGCERWCNHPSSRIRQFVPASKYPSATGARVAGSVVPTIG
jgi:hypothetical protein